MVCVRAGWMNTTTMRMNRRHSFFIFVIVLATLNLTTWLLELITSPYYSHVFSQDLSPINVNYTAPRWPYDAHLGARHANGSLGLIVDPSPNRLLPPFDIQPKNETACNVGIEGRGGRQVLDKVRKGISAYHTRTTNSYAANSTRPRILCMVYTYEQSHINVQAIARTWGRQCDGFFAGSNFTDLSIGAINLLHHGPEAYKNMWQKIRSMWAYAYDFYQDRYDYFYICGDDVYLAVDNLRMYLEGEQIRQLLNGHLDVFSKLNEKAAQWKTKRPRPILLGMPMNYNMLTFPSGGCGYVLNRAALDLLARVVLEEFLPNATDPREDVFVGSALWEHGVCTADSRDEEGAFRFGGNAEEMYNFNGVASPVGPKVMRRRFGVDMFPGMKGVSSKTISFHLKGTNVPEMILRYHMLLQGYCDEHALWELD